MTRRDDNLEVGKRYVGWREGEFDMHFISAGASESVFLVCPDGTTVLIDAGDRNPETFKAETGMTAYPTVPDASRRPGKWIARYVGRVRPDVKTIDYLVATHYHPDHVGDQTLDVLKKGPAPDEDYKLTGIPEVGEFYRFGTAFDRDYPRYSFQREKRTNIRDNLRKYLEYAAARQGLRREEFRPGALDQLRLLNAPEEYDFHVRNVCCNGRVWRGVEEEVDDYYELYPKTLERNCRENTPSIGLLFRYGAFRFFTGGDVMGKIYVDDENLFEYESVVGRAVGPVDVCKANHHAYRNAMAPEFEKAVQARVYVVFAWNDSHLSDSAAAAMVDYSGSDDPDFPLLCPTRLSPEKLAATASRPWRRNTVDVGGHVVVKAFDGGARYKVYYLEDQDESMTVKATFGPYKSRGDKTTPR